MTASPLSVDLGAAPRIETGLILWLAMFAFVALCLGFAAALPWITAYPPEWVLPVATVRRTPGSPRAVIVSLTAPVSRKVAPFSEARALAATDCVLP